MTAASQRASVQDTTGSDPVASLWEKATRAQLAGDDDETRSAYQGIVLADKTQSFAWLCLAAAAERDGCFNEAHQLLMRGAEYAISHRRWKVLPYLAQRLLAYDETQLVGSLVAQADWSDQAVLSQAPALLQALWLSDAHDAALRLVLHARNLAPRSHLLNLVHGNVLRSIGRIEAASEAYESCIAQEPLCVDAHLALAKNQPLGRSGDRIDRIIRVLRRCPSGGLASVQAGYALFMELDTAGDEKAAWGFLEAAAKTMRALVTYDAAAGRRGIDMLQSAERNALHWPSEEPGMVPGRVNLFIVGLPRTGTTVLDRIVGGHPGSASAGELTTIACSLSHEADRYCRLPLGVSDQKVLQGVSMRRVGARYIRKTRTISPAATLLIDKTPNNIFAVNYILAAIPSARVACLRKEPMDACFSNYKELFHGNAYPHSYDQAELAGHCQNFESLHRYWAERFPDRFRVVQYEEMVGEPRECSLSMLDFCGLARRDGCERIQENGSPVTTASSSQVREPIHGRAVGAWRRYDRYLTVMQDTLAAAR